ncbi:bacitracin ABC transporter ATP-binding protein [Oceanobacillus neutriphilus]|uniref:Bacitracin ABC transporter ATP-binding protein n=1 Tax=Oceanobacillus neutriphilus TaxID=531815 RepID=A0ABQ2P2J0_9BACI|nr:ATP-binding cassette domain-containing protein [Oceanobacillus neutriphilus]GGP16693.1 bacitracin ABC transporter ATP-binding protein [Oceanobacillus neutriphilus]
MEYILRTHDLGKSFNGDNVVSSINMNIRKGEIYGLLGPNGAGKSTVMKMILNLLKPSQGAIEIFNETVTDTSYELFKRMNAIIEYPIFYEKLTAEDNLDMHCEYMGYHNKQDIKAALDLVNLKNITNKAVKNFSLGMKQRLGIARAIITKPELLILDEPVNGLDPVGIIEIRNLLEMLNKEYGITILISSHILAEIEQIADTIGVMNNGHLVEEVSMDSIRENNAEYIEIETADAQKVVYIIDSELNIKNFKVLDTNKIRIYETGMSQNQIYKKLMENDISITSINTKSASLEDHFLSLIGGGENA